MVLIDVDIEEYLDEVSAADLADELSSRGYTIFDKAGKCVSDPKRAPLGKKLPEDYVLCRDFDRHKLREHLLAITGLGSYVTDDELLQRIKELLIYG